MLCWIVVAILSFATLHTTTMTVAGQVSSEAKAERRRRVCRSDTDCVVVKATNGGTLLLDELQLDSDTVEAIERLLPEWFGERPCRFTSRGLTLTKGLTLAQQGVAIGDTIDMVVVGGADAGANANEHDEQ